MTPIVISRHTLSTLQVKQWKFKGQGCWTYSLVHPCCQNSIWYVLLKCSPAAMCLWKPYWGSPWGRENHMWGCCPQVHSPSWSWCILQVRRSAASSISGLSLCVCVCVHRKEWEGETAHFLCPLIRSVVTMALRRIQLSWRWLSSLPRDAACRRLIQSAFWLS